VTLEELETAIDAELQRLKDEPITDEEVSRATKRLVSEAVYARDSLSGAVRSFGIALTTGRTVDDVEAWPERIAAVTADQINAAADYVLNLDNSVTGQLKPVPPPDMAIDDASTNQPVHQ